MDRSHLLRGPLLELAAYAQSPVVVNTCHESTDSHMPNLPVYLQLPWDSFDLSEFLNMASPRLYVVAFYLSEVGQVRLGRCDPWLRLLPSSVLQTVSIDMVQAPSFDHGFSEPRCH